MTTEYQKEYLLRCFSLSRLGDENVSPNPCVGAVLVHENKIIGEGYHHSFGSDHAEIDCLNSVKSSDKSKIASAIMYVSLEPCSHHGKTPPCTDAIIRNGIKKVVIASLDPHPLVSGKGVKALRDAGIDVVLADCHNQALEANSSFLFSHYLHRPYITLKWAQSTDGYMSKLNVQTKISNHLSDIAVHKWRSRMDAILIGARTAFIDNPRLTTRLVEGKSPIRILLDRQLSVPSAHHLYDDPFPTWTFTLKEKASTGLKRFIKLPEDVDQQLPFIMSYLHDLHIQRLMIEGGGKVLKSFVKSGLWDEARVITAPKKLDAGVKAPSVFGSKAKSYQFGKDSVEVIRNKESFQGVLDKMGDSYS